MTFANFPGNTTLAITELQSAVTALQNSVTAIQNTLNALPTGPIGYTTAGQGVGGTVTQTTSITTPVTINTLCGKITTVVNPWSIGAVVQFQVFNSKVLQTDVIAIHQTGNGTAVLSGFLTFAGPVLGGGSFVVTVDPFVNQTVSLDITFAIIRTVTT